MQTKKNELQSVPLGSPVYEWEYLDSSGELQKEKVNVYQKIQSYAKQHDYKAKFKRGEEIIDERGVYMDISKFGNGFIGFDEYLDGIAAGIYEDIQASKSSGEIGKDSSPNPETAAPSVGTETEGGERK